MLSLEVALEYIEKDQRVEVMPAQLRLRKIVLRDAARRRLARPRA